MSDLSTFERVRTVIAEQLGHDEHIITEHSNIREDFGTDSLDELEIIMAIEEEFGIAISDDEAAEVGNSGSVANMVAFIDGKIAL